MEKIMCRGYKIIVIVMVLVCLYASATFRLDIRQTHAFRDTDIVDTIAYSQWDNAYSPTGKSDVYSFQPEYIGQDYNKLFVYTAHQSVKVYVGNKLLYHVYPYGGGLYSKTTGRVWSEIRLTPEDAGKIIHIECIPCFAYTAKIKPVVYFGEEHDIKYQIVLRDLLVMFLCSMVILVGFVMSLTELLKKRKDRCNEVMLYAGFFTFFSGIWKILQCSIFGLYMARFPILSEVPTFCLLLIGLPFLLSVKGMLKSEGKIWRVPIVIYFVTLIASLALLLTGTTILMQSVVVMGIVAASSMTVIGIETYRQWKKSGMTDVIKYVIIECGACSFWYICDALIYYFSRGEKTSAVGILGVSVYVGTVLRYSMKNAVTMMETGMHARQFSKLAFRDALTGFHNRAAYAEHLDNKQYRKVNTVVLMCDLNDLKKCNDTYGHDKGDLYIKESAKIIRNCFGDLGQCYRLGGDEFSVLMPEADHEEVKLRCQRLMEQVEEFNRQSEDIKMGIAHGYAWFKENEDLHFDDLLKRADRMMYENKKLIKQQANS